jgi:OPT oligopeptide transporter protein
MFLWSWVPGHFAKSISAISVFCLITNNKTAKFLGSAHASGGVGLLSFTLDWSMIGIYSPIATPWWATVNWFLGNVIWTWMVIPICYYMNVWGSPTLQSDYHFADGNDFEILNTNKIFNRYIILTQDWL